MQHDLQPRRAAAASLIGTAIEYYDFFIYGTAATLVFGKVFFPGLGGTLATMVSLSTFGVAFFVRPLGGIVIGHLGDKVGRKPMLVFTIGAMGMATVLIGLLPSYAQIGVAAPVLLILLRMLQGFALGGEYGGAVLMSLEHSPQHKRGFYGSFVMVGAIVGLILALLAFLPAAAMGKEAFLSWGWRIPFLLSAVLLVLGVVIRRAIAESPTFAETRKADQIAEAPLVDVIKHHPGSALLVAGSSLAGGVAFYVLVVFTLGYRTTVVGTPYNVVLGTVIAASVLDIAFMVMFGRLSDRIGRRPVYVGGCLGVAVLTLPALWLIASASTAVSFLGYVLIMLPLACLQGVGGVFFAETFTARVRYSGLSLGYTLGMLAGSAVAPMIAAALAGPGGSLTPVGLYVIAMALVSFFSASYLSQPVRVTATSGSRDVLVKTPALSWAQKTRNSID